MADDTPFTPLPDPVYFPAGDETLFGVFTQADTPGSTGVLVASGGLTGTSTVGRNQLYVQLSRGLAADGYHSLRFDYHGMGESTGILEEFRLDAEGPFVDDLVGAAGWMRQQGMDEIVLLGKCFGSRMGLSAVSRLGPLGGVVLIGPPVRDFGKGERAVARLATDLSARDILRRVLRPEVVRKLADPRHRAVYTRAAMAKVRAIAARLDRTPDRRPDDMAWVSRRFFEPLASLVDQRVPVQLIYGVDDDFYQDFLKASQRGRLAELLARAGPMIEVSEVHGLVRGYAHAGGQQAIIEAARAWMARRDDAVPSLTA